MDFLTAQGETQAKMDTKLLLQHPVPSISHLSYTCMATAHSCDCD
jgi:hypothetical protein